MAETETITLPKIGLVLPRHPAQHPRWQLRAGDHEFIIEQTFIDGSRWYAGSCFVAGDRTRYCVGHYGTRDECLAWLDARALELRAALLPPGAIVVRDTPETRERIARKLNATHREFAQTPNSLCYDCDCPDQDDNAPPPFDEMCDGCKSSQMEEADAVLAALREAPRG